jgi:hypothetical protein
VARDHARNLAGEELGKRPARRCATASGRPSLQRAVPDDQSTGEVQERDRDRQPLEELTLGLELTL